MVSLTHDGVAVAHRWVTSVDRCNFAVRGQPTKYTHIRVRACMCDCDQRTNRPAEARGLSLLTGATGEIG